MKILPRFRSWLRAVVHRSRTEADMDEELRAHIQNRADDLIRSGLARAEAERRARLEFGGYQKFKEECREAVGVHFFETLLQDLRFAFRMLRKSPGFTSVAVLTLALGIGANTAIFSVVNGILLTPLPYVDSSRLVIIQRQRVSYGISPSELREIQQHCTALEDMATHRLNEVLVTGAMRPELAWTAEVSGDFFSLLGVKPLLGRPLLPQDTQSDSNRVAVLSYRFWMDFFGGDTSIVGHRISVDHKPYSIVGVMPKKFNLDIDWGWANGIDEELWVPPVRSWSDPKILGPPVSVIARLKHGAPIEATNAQLKILSARFVRSYPSYAQEGNQLEVSARPLGRYIDPSVQSALLILLGAVGFVLLMACVNVTSLLVARSWTRQQELAIRRTLGASRPRILRQLLSESLLLAISGGAFGLVLSVWGIRLIRLIAPPFTPRIDSIRFNANVLWFTMAISLLVAILVGLAPAMHATSRRVGISLKGGLAGSFAGSTMQHSRRFRNTLVILELALAIVVVVGGTLMARSFYKLMSLDTGVRADHVLTMSVHLSDLVCKDNVPGTRCQLATEEILKGIRSLPGVQQAALSHFGPLQGGEVTESRSDAGRANRAGLYVDGRPENQLTSGVIIGRSVSPGFFAALGINLVSGRGFVPGDLSDSHVAIVSESFARKYIPGNPLGSRFSTSEDEKGHHYWMDIVGVVNDVRDRAVRHFISGPVYYTPFWFGGKNWTIFVRTAASPASLVPAIARVVGSVDPDAPIENVQTVDQIIAESSAEPKFQAVLLGSFGILGLLLAIIGTYGVVSYSVVQRTHEIGVRVALGAGRGDVLRMILGEGLLLASIGIAIGVAGALALTRFLRSLLFEVKPTDPVTFIGVSILLALVALAACYLPARRAMKVDPMVALRYE